jgi:beta-phosphoglucomutase
MSIKAFIFDLDGTIINSMPLHDQAWALCHRRRGLAFDSEGFFERSAGRTMAEILAVEMPNASAAEHAAYEEEKESVFRELAKKQLRYIAGFEAFHAAAQASGIVMAIGTAAPPPNVQVVYECLGLDKLINVIASPAEGLRGKPEPDIFLSCAQKLGVPAAQCLVFEDAPLGIEAARRAGMRAVALATTLEHSAFAAYSNCITTVADFDELQLSDLLV